MALALFAGLRPSEIDDLEPGDVLEGRIRVQGGKLRRTLRRRTPIPPVLATWLEAYPFTGQPAGYRNKFRVLKAAVASDRWVQDILRHTSISFQLERDKDEARTAFNNGTSKQMIDLHYRDVIDDPQVVEAFWNLTPEVIQKVTLTGPCPAPQKSATGRPIRFLKAWCGNCHWSKSDEGSASAIMQCGNGVRAGGSVGEGSKMRSLQQIKLKADFSVHLTAAGI